MNFRNYNKSKLFLMIRTLIKLVTVVSSGFLLLCQIIFGIMLFFESRNPDQYDTNQSKINGICRYANLENTHILTKCFLIHMSILTINFVAHTHLFNLDKEPTGNIYLMIRKISVVICNYCTVIFLIFVFAVVDLLMLFDHWNKYKFNVCNKDINLYFNVGGFGIFVSTILLTCLLIHISILLVFREKKTKLNKIYKEFEENMGPVNRESIKLTIKNALDPVVDNSENLITLEKTNEVPIVTIID